MVFSMHGVKQEKFGCVSTCTYIHPSSHILFQSYLYSCNVYIQSVYIVICGNQASVKYAQKFAQYAFENIPKFLPIMLSMLSIMLVLCSNVNNIDVKILWLECSIRVFLIKFTVWQKLVEMMTHPMKIETVATKHSIIRGNTYC